MELRDLPPNQCRAAFWASLCPLLCGHPSATKVGDEQGRDTFVWRQACLIFPVAGQVASPYILPTAPVSWLVPHQARVAAAKPGPALPWGLRLQPAEQLEAEGSSARTGQPQARASYQNLQVP